MNDSGGLGATLPLATNHSNQTSCPDINTSVSYVFMVVYSLLFLVGLLLNGFTLKVYFCRSQLTPQTSSSVTIYLKNLAAADFLISLCLPVRILNYGSSSVPVRLVYCNFGASVFYLNMYASILFMGYIAANRYLKIVHPLGTHVLQKVRTAYIVSIVTWAFLLAMMCTYVLVSLLTQERRDSIPAQKGCDALHSQQLSVLYKVIHTCSAAIFLLVLVSLVVFYHGTSRRLSQAQQRQPASSGSKKLEKSRRNMLVLVSVFCICFVPYHLVRIPYAFRKEWECSWTRVFFYLKELTVLLSVLNVCLDPLIYFIFCKAFRSQLSLRRAASTTHLPTGAVSVDRRNSERRLSSVKLNRKLSLSSATKPTNIL
ncbi:P2Y purinoceptor 14-like [Mugil cephalus]|uniref:P2Y purinoceptor 14-like n=1 Tax=Mugil cephalus TaxID=48193 RepID=UPI001FB81387|nr:P2Y purinoceptor 14-like [Mugil cephalus]